MRIHKKAWRRLWLLEGGGGFTSIGGLAVDFVNSFIKLAKQLMFGSLGGGLVAIWVGSVCRREDATNIHTKSTWNMKRTQEEGSASITC